MPVNFLPLPHNDSEAGIDMSGMTDSEDCGDMNPAAVDDTVDDKDAEYRTSVWVSELPSEETGNTGLVNDVQ